MIGLLRRITHEPLGLIGIVLVVLITVSALLAAWLAPYDPVALNIADRLQGPSASHLLGTDQLGRDLLSRVLYGGQVALKVALIRRRIWGTQATQIHKEGWWREALRPIRRVTVLPGSRRLLSEGFREV